MRPISPFCNLFFFVEDNDLHWEEKKKEEVAARAWRWELQRVQLVLMEQRRGEVLLGLFLNLVQCVR